MSKTNSYRFAKLKALLPSRILRDDRGSAFIELALILPTFVILCVGAAEFGRLAFASIEVSNAARAGVAYGSRNHATASNSSAMQAAALGDASDVASMSATAGPCICPASAATASVPACTTAFFTGANAFSSCPAVSGTTEYVQVDTSAAVPSMFQLPGLPTSYTVYGSATMTVEQ
jgi:Flp pilus assembly protein TadG